MCSKVFSSRFIAKVIVLKTFLHHFISPNSKLFFGNVSNFYLVMQVLVFYNSSAKNSVQKSKDVHAECMEEWSQVFLVLTEDQKYASKHSESGLSYKLEDGPEALALYVLTAPFAVILYNYTLPVPAIAAESGYKMC